MCAGDRRRASGADYATWQLGSGKPKSMVASEPRPLLPSVPAISLARERLQQLQQPAPHPAVLRCRDAPVQAGSSSAFLLRDDFVTPTGVAAAGR